MKAISIGRDNECNIVLNDKTDVVSRRHAVLNITSTGKMTIIDQSHNGTYVNGIRVTSNTPFPVTRKDVVSFAHIIQLDWNLVPNTAAKMRNGIMGIIALVIILCGSTAYLVNNRGHKDLKANVVNTLKKDSIKQDSTKKDTIKSKKAITKNNKEIKTGEKKKRKSIKKVVENKEKETQPKKEKEVNNRTIG